MFNKKNNARTGRKLTLTRETVKRLNETLTEQHLKQAAGGWGSNNCSNCCDASVTTEPC